jgi:hypothetical protein
MEDAIVSQILRSPGFHNGVRAIHRRVQDYRHGRNPDEPLRPGEATEDPSVSKTGFLTHFIDEIKNQFRGTPSDDLQPPSKTGDDWYEVLKRKADKDKK